ncbi:class I SAM-dependent methyltransferase [Hydrogenivirga sp. 128-5-R1-1]|uniref:class I SAM-dependent methyltransferase n=1 Tax=Hydrogenivirga sp. 128-5-R1-1 TaxID=392423 RepID=UPI00015F2E87|nr:class I SAM-dependent methyltransferase [Hydrogenivirga sp. 128-5-R1-1]EDP73810.1 Tellurite resistance protein TehB [Hydrogenivirga sp. 128-5-R1-1]
MIEDRERWNKKYLSEKLPEEPSEIVKNFYSLAKKGKALDIAAGTGRNSIFLHKKGFQVDAVDISDVALNILKKKQPEINTIQADLDNFDFPLDRYEIVLNINFLNRNLIPKIKDSLKKDGVLIFETFVLNEEAKTKDFYLRKNELLHLFIDFYVVYYQEFETKRYDGRNALKASLAAIKKC